MFAKLSPLFLVSSGSNHTAPPQNPSLSRSIQCKKLEDNKTTDVCRCNQQPTHETKRLPISLEISGTFELYLGLSQTCRLRPGVSRVILFHGARGPTTESEATSSRSTPYTILHSCFCGFLIDLFTFGRAIHHTGNENWRRCSFEYYFHPSYLIEIILGGGHPPRYFSKII